MFLFFNILKLFSFFYCFILFSFCIQALGMEETAARINVMVERAKQNIEMSELIPLDCLVNIKLSYFP